MSFKFLRSMFFVGSLSFMACQAVTTDRRTAILADSNGDGYASSGACGVEPAFEGCGDVASDPTIADDCIVFPSDCPLVQWSEEHTVIYDENGNIIEETYTTCTQCLDEDGNAIGEEECSTNVVEPIVCYNVDSQDPSVSCWECSSPAGEVLYGGCDPIPVYCESDAECLNGEVCQLFPGWECDPNVDFCPMMPEFNAGGICVAPIEGCYSDDDCNAGERCAFAPWDCADDMACPAVEQGTCIADVDPNCYSDFDCAPGDRCEWIDFECPPGAVCADVMQGVCVPGAEGCDSLRDEQSCSASGCDWIPDPNVACFTEPCDFGTCTNPQPQPGEVCYNDDECGVDAYCQFQEWDCAPGMACPAVLTGVCTPLPVDNCSGITDEQACGATDGCGWFYYGMPCLEGEACVTGVCQAEGDCGTEILPAP